MREHAGAMCAAHPMAMSVAAAVLCTVLLLLPAGLHALPPSSEPHVDGSHAARQLLGGGKGKGGKGSRGGGGGSSDPEQERLALLYTANGLTMISGVMLLYAKQLPFEAIQIPSTLRLDPRGPVVADVDRMNATLVDLVKSATPFAMNRALGLLAGPTPDPILIDRKANVTVQGGQAIADYLDAEFKGPKLVPINKADKQFLGSQLTFEAERASVAARRTLSCLDARTGVVSGRAAPEHCTRDTADVYLDDFAQYLAYLEQVLPDYLTVYGSTFTRADAKLLALFIQNQYWGVDFEAKGYKAIAFYLDKMRPHPVVASALSHFPLLEGIPKPQRDAFQDVDPFRPRLGAPYNYACANRACSTASDCPKVSYETVCDAVRGCCYWLPGG